MYLDKSYTLPTSKDVREHKIESKYFYADLFDLKHFMVKSGSEVRDDDNFANVASPLLEMIQQCNKRLRFLTAI